MRNAGRRTQAWLVTGLLALIGCGSDASSTGSDTEDASDGTRDASTGDGDATDAGLGDASHASRADTDGAVPDFTSSFDPDRLVSELSDDDVLALCDELDAWANELYAAIGGDVCEFAGLFAAALLPGDPVANCEAQAAMCRTSPTESTTTCNLAETASCTATVAEIEACLDAAREAFVTAFGALDCSLAADPNALPAGGPAPPVTPDACTVLAETCPGVSIQPPMPAL